MCRYFTFLLNYSSVIYFCHFPIVCWLGKVSLQGWVFFPFFFLGKQLLFLKIKSYCSHKMSSNTLGGFPSVALFVPETGSST